MGSSAYVNFLRLFVNEGMKVTLMAKVEGTKVGQCVITPTLREGVGGQRSAWHEACNRLLIDYDACCHRRPDLEECDFNLVLTVVPPQHIEPLPADPNARVK